MKKVEKTDVSVIMPVYNTEPYLREALDSLLKQTNPNIEIICVDDGSTDASASILKEYTEKDPRVQILRQDHQGAGAARNLGMESAQGEYLLFLDADDFFTDTLVEEIAKKGNKTNADVILFGARKYDDLTGRSEHVPRYLWRKLLPVQEVFSRKTMEGELFTLTTPAPWNKSFRREYIQEQKLKFQNLPNSNDVYFTLTALGAAERVAAVREDLVYYRVNYGGSLQNRKDQNPLCFLEAYESVYKELTRRGIYEELEIGFCNMVASGCVYNLRTLHSEQVRQKVIDKLCSDRFLDMHLLEHADEEYDMPENINYLRGLPYAREVRKERERRQNYGDIRCIKEGKSTGHPVVTVVIAAYNVEKYLEESLDSIIGQTLKELEIICIDDGSTDYTLGILKHYAEEDERISVYTQENCGLSVTRNRGIKAASGDYIYFMDSDDWLEREALEQLAGRCQEHDLEVLYYDGCAFFEEKDMEDVHNEFDGYYQRKGNYPACCDGKEMFQRMQKTKEYRTNVGMQFFKRRYLEEHHFAFQPGILHEDIDFTFMTMLMAERCGYWKKEFFHRRVRSGSIMTAKTSFEHIYGLMKSYVAMEHFLGIHSMPEEMADVLYDTMHTVLWRAAKQYSEMPEAQKYAYEGLWGLDKIQFQTLVREHTRITEKLFRTYKEKSEINRKLQITYGEKFDRGVEIKKLKKELAETRKELTKTQKKLSGIQYSATYRVARVIGFPIRMIRKLFKKAKEQ